MDEKTPLLRILSVISANTAGQRSMRPAFRFRDFGPGALRGASLSAAATTSRMLIGGILSASMSRCSNIEGFPTGREVHDGVVDLFSRQFDPLGTKLIADDLIWGAHDFPQFIDKVPPAYFLGS